MISATVGQALSDPPFVTDPLPLHERWAYDVSMDRRHFLAATAATAALATRGRIGTVTTQQNPRITDADIDILNARTATLKWADLQYGGDHMYTVGVQDARDAYKLLLHGECPMGLQRPFYTAVGWMASTVGFQAFDIGKDNDARHWYGVAETCAREVQNWSLLARVIGQKARLCTYRDQPTWALSLLDEPISHPAALTPTDLAMLWALKARAHATAHQPAEADTAAQTADAWLYEHANDADTWGRPWIAHYNKAHHNGDIASGEATLTRAGYPRLASATKRYTRSMNGHVTSGSTRSIALTQLGLVRIEAERGDLGRAVDIGWKALDVVPQIKSNRVNDNLRQACDGLSVHLSHRPAHELYDEMCRATVA